MTYKSIVGPNFGVVMAELQEAIQEGWQIDFNNYPIDNFTRYEVHLTKDVGGINTVYNPEDTMTSTEIQAARKPAGRPAKAKN